MSAGWNEEVEEALAAAFDRLEAERDRLAAERDRYREAFSQLVNEIGEHVEWLRRWETDPDMSPHRAAAELEAAIDDIEREQGIDE